MDFRSGLPPRTPLEQRSCCCQYWRCYVASGPQRTRARSDSLRRQLTPTNDEVPSMAAGQVLQQIILKAQKELLTEWLQAQLSVDSVRTDLMKESELREQSREFLALLQDAVRAGDL